MTIKFLRTAAKQLSKLDNSIQLRIKRYLQEISELQEDPTIKGKALLGNLSGYYRYRFEDYRIICQIKADELIICVVKIGHRREVYQGISKN